MKLPCLCLFVFYFCSTIVDSRKRGGYKEAILSCNAYIDSMIQEVLKDHGDYLDPHSINESQVQFHKKVAFIDFKGEAKLNDGHISGLKDLHRTSSCALSFDQGRLKVKAKMEVDKISFNATGYVKALNMHRLLTVNGYTSTVFLSTTLSLDASGNDSALDNLNVDYIHNITIDSLESLRFLKWMEEPIVFSVGDFFNVLTHKLVEVQAKSFFEERMKDKPFSLEQFDLDIGDLEVTTTEGDTLIGQPIYTKEDADSYIDSVLENRFNLEAQYSRLNFPDFLDDHRIEKVYVSNEEDNYLDLKDGLLENLMKIKRIEDCTQPILKSSNITFTCSLGYQRLKFVYSAESHNGNSISEFELVVLVDNTKLDVKITTTVKDNIPSMLDLNVDYLGKMKILSSHTVADAPTMQAESTFDKEVLINHFSELLRTILLGKLKEVLGYSIYKTPIHFVDRI